MRTTLARGGARGAALLCLLSAACGNQDTLVLSLRTQPGMSIKSYAVQVQDRGTRKLSYYSGVKQLATARELSETPLRIGLKFDQRGSFLIHVRAARIAELESLPRPAQDASAEPELFFATVHTTFTVPELDALLLPILPQFDKDRDHFPDAATWLAADPVAAELYAARPEVLDCVDKDPLSGNLLPPSLAAADIHPMARPLCNVTMRQEPTDPTAPPQPFEPLDITCSGQPRSCEDADGDGDPAQTDCDDYDPRRFHGNPRPRNCCQCTDRQSCAKNHEKIADLSLCQPARCGVSFDYDCTGRTVDCFIDEDCDGYAANAEDPKLRDCDDNDVRVFPGAPVICDPAPEDANKDWACDGNPKRGCVPCDLDGDGFQRDSALAPETYSNTRCPSEEYKKTGKPIDCDDNDRGVFPGAATFDSPTLLVHDLSRTQFGGTVAGALRGLCRNVDLDGRSPQNTNCDGKPREGCPAQLVMDPTCDRDGDGFPSQECKDRNPELLARYPADCMDDPAQDPEAAQIFPGAPVKCPTQQGDRNCDNLPDNCGTDRDLDGYDAQNDCNDQAKDSHPFADELCDGRDNDCDGLIDEQNPSDRGQRMIEELSGGQKVIQSCNDSKVGLCGSTKRRDGARFTGRCVCTAFVPKSINQSQMSVLPGGRDRCPGEPDPLPEPKDSDRPAPRCFDAYQPVPQTCDAQNPVDDDCDGRDDDPEGKNLREKIQEFDCGRTVGECRTGKVAGCDRKRVSPFSAQSGRRVPGYNESERFYVCNDRAVPPRDEICNGKDDDCDGRLPGPQDAPLPNESDADGDLYMSCRNCVARDVKAPLKGCADCDDGNNFVYPGAPERCDGLNNACKADFVESVDDGVGACTADGVPACCSRQCVDLKASFFHCGACGAACNDLHSDRCVDGKCKCNNDAVCAQASAKPWCLKNVGCVECLQDGNCKNPLRCDANANVCTRCTKNDHCAMPTPYCRVVANKPQENACVECLSSEHCKTNYLKPLCDPMKNVCVACLEDQHCKDARTGDKCADGVCKCANQASCKDEQPACDEGMGCRVCLPDGYGCDAGRVCLDKRSCVACNGGADQCLEHQTCAETRCAACGAMDNQCKMGQHCTNNQCAACNPANPSTCPMGLQCSNSGACVACTSNEHCKQGQTCDSNTFTCMNANCSNDNDCKAPQRCDTNTNRCVACTMDAHCGAGRRCFDKKICVACLNDNDCAGKGEVCSAAHRCVACTEDVHCKAGQKCVNNQCHGCREDADCRKNQRCMDGACMVP